MSLSSTGEQGARRRTLLIWGGIGALLLVAFSASVGAMARETYSPEAFVREYLDALARHDVDAALGMPGVVLTSSDEPGTGAASLLQADALGSLSDVSLVSDVEIAPDRYRLVFSYSLVGSDRHVTDGRSEFDVVRSGSSALVFPTWSFAKSPIASATVTVAHASTFTAGAAEIDTGDPSAFHASGSYEVLVPGMYVLSHSGDFLGAKSIGMAATAPLSSISAIVDVQPKLALVNAVQDSVNTFLDACATQTVLYPPGCPFGLAVDNRIIGSPQWSIEQYPTISIIAGQSSWVVPSNSGSAHVTVGERSLYDGSESTIDESVPFTVTFTLTVEPDGTVTFAQR
ncbi:hypothetical protein ACFJGV_11925 [Cnuibacter sp. UC19_7]|uniref:hypothetical protein n=1 Tax=Cnuibacter sp. UC19_7 TaxID=3350166 RepID=UPI00366D5B88